MDREIFKLLVEKIKLCAEWSGSYNVDLKKNLYIIADQIKEVADV